MSNFISIKGPMEDIGGHMFLRIPLEAGGDKLAECTEGISSIEDGFLKIEILDWMAEKLQVKTGSIVHVDNENGEFNIREAE